jgi:hypothetical protein
MEYTRQICIDSLDFDELLKQNHDGRMFLNMSCLLNFIFGAAVVALGNYATNRLLAIDHLQQEKRSLMDLVVTLEDELTAKYVEEDEEEVLTKSEEEEKSDEAEDLTKPDEDDDLTKPDVVTELDELQDEHID